MTKSINISIDNYIQTAQVISIFGLIAFFVLSQTFG